MSLVSRASGAGGARGTGSSTNPSLSADGRFVAFVSEATNLSPDDTDTYSDVYVRDLQTNVTVLVSRASGANGENSLYGPDRAACISGNGRYVAFETKAPNLSPDDGDYFSDVYVRDLVANTTTLVSRASGASGVKSNDASNVNQVTWLRPEGSCISDDGRFVVFDSEATNLSPDDTVSDPISSTDEDVYVRDLVAQTTTLVSRATGSSGAKGADGASYRSAISADGGTVVFESVAPNLSPDDTDTVADIYARDLASGTTTLVSRATGISGAKGPYQADGPTVSGDGRLVAFYTGAPLDPDDTDSGYQHADVYVRDLQAATTTLVDRANGPSGAKADAGDVPYLSAGGRFIVFDAAGPQFGPENPTGGGLYVRDLVNNVSSLELRASPGYERMVRPRGATPVRFSLVPAAVQCTSPNNAHGAPLSYGSCSPVSSPSPNVALSFGEVRARSIGFVILKAVPGDNQTTADEADVRITFSLTNVMKMDASDYTGELQGRIGVRLTDRFNGPTGREEGTLGDFDLPFTAPCSATTSTTDGAACALTTTADTVLPGFAPEAKRGVYGLAQLRVYDGGPDQDGDTAADNSLLAVQGLFAP